MRLAQMPDLDPKGLWAAEETAIRNTEMSLKSFKPRALIQMATGSGKDLHCCEPLLPEPGSQVGSLRACSTS